MNYHLLLCSQEKQQKEGAWIVTWGVVSNAERLAVQGKEKRNMF